MSTGSAKLGENRRAKVKGALDTHNKGTDLLKGKTFPLTQRVFCH